MLLWTFYHLLPIEFCLLSFGYGQPLGSPYSVMVLGRSPFDSFNLTRYRNGMSTLFLKFFLLFLKPCIFNARRGYFFLILGFRREKQGENTKIIVHLIRAGVPLKGERRRASCSGSCATACVLVKCYEWHLTEWYMRVCLRVIYEHLHLLWGGIISAGRVGVSLSACVLPWLQACVYQAPRHPPREINTL